MSKKLSELWREVIGDDLDAAILQRIEIEEEVRDSFRVPDPLSHEVELAEWDAQLAAARKHPLIREDAPRSRVR